MAENVSEFPSRLRDERDLPEKQKTPDYAGVLLKVANALD